MRVKFISVGLLQYIYGEGGGLTNKSSLGPIGLWPMCSRSRFNVKTKRFTQSALCYNLALQIIAGLQTTMILMLEYTLINCATQNHKESCAK